MDAYHSVITDLGDRILLPAVAPKLFEKLAVAASQRALERRWAERRDKDRGGGLSSTGVPAEEVDFRGRVSLD
eukprot:185815-Lingulodinium_polyedra.AAC.1